MGIAKKGGKEKGRRARRRSVPGHNWQKKKKGREKEMRDPVRFQFSSKRKKEGREGGKKEGDPCHPFLKGKKKKEKGKRKKVSFR